MKVTRRVVGVGLATLALVNSLPRLQAAELNDYGPITAASNTIQRPGAPVWMDLLTGDVPAAVKFYSEVFGWQFETSDGGEYAYATLDGQPVASIVAYDAALGDTEGLWIPSLSVPDVDQAMEAVKNAGGTIIEPPEDLPGRGRYVLAEDPTGAAFMLLRASGGDPTPDKAVNEWCWNELWTDDTDRALAFYEAVLGYRSVAIKDSAGNQYEVLGRDHQPHVGVIKTPLPDVGPNWLGYVLVKDVDKTARAVLRAGGAVLVPPRPDGFNSDLAIVADPTGGVLALQQEKEAE